MSSNNIGLVSGIDNSIIAGGGAKPSKLHEAAQQFEALIVGEMMRAQREAGSEGWLGSGGGTEDDTAMDMAEGQFSKALASGHGLGLASMIEKTMSRNEAADQSVSTRPQLYTTPTAGSSADLLPR